MEVFICKGEGRTSTDKEKSTHPPPAAFKTHDMRLLSQPVITADEVKATLMILSTTKYLWTLLYHTEIANPQQHP